jgi:hypothetical protein
MKSKCPPVRERTCRLECRMMQIRGALPDSLKILWIFASPLALLFSVRILWEKTVWTWSRGPQTVGFALLHIHPGFAVLGIVSSSALALWLLVAIPYAVARRRNIGPWDWVMMASSVFVIVALTLPDTFFA